MADNKELSAMIDQLVETKTFSLDALDAIKELKDKASDLERMLTSRTESLRVAASNIQNLESELYAAREIVAGWIKREGEIIAREKSIHTIDRDAAVSKAKAETYADVFKTVFANRILRENVMESTSTPVNNGGYVEMRPGHSNKTTEITES